MMTRTIRLYSRALEYGALAVVSAAGTGLLAAYAIDCLWHYGDAVVAVLGRNEVKFD